MMKRLTALLLILLCITNMNASVYAKSDGFESATANYVYAQHIGNGQFQLSQQPSAMQTVPAISKTGLIQAKSTDQEAVYQISENQYLVQAFDDMYLMSQKILVNANDIFSNSKSLTKYHFSDKTIRKMIDITKKQQALKNEEFFIEIYVPLSNASGVDDTELREYNYTKNGFSYYMLDHILIYRHVATDSLRSTGPEAKDVGRKWFNLVVSAVGTYSKTVSIFGDALSMWGIIKDICPATWGSTSEDFTDTYLVYDLYEKTTSVYTPAVGTYLEGCISAQVFIDKMSCTFFDASTGLSDHTQISVNTWHTTENYHNPAMAIDMVGSPYCDIGCYTYLYGTRVWLTGL